MPILVFLDLSVLDLGPMYATDRRETDRQASDVRQHDSLMPPPRGIINVMSYAAVSIRTPDHCVIDSI